MAVVAMLATGFLTAGCGEPNSSDFDPMGDAADAAGMALTDVPLDQVEACVESTKFGAYIGDPDSRARWNSAGQSETALADACTQIGRKNPEMLATMQREWNVEQTTLQATAP